MWPSYCHQLQENLAWIFHFFIVMMICFTFTSLKLLKNVPFAERSSSYAAARLFTKLPVKVKQLEAVESFKKHLKTYFFFFFFFFAWT